MKKNSSFKILAVLMAIVVISAFSMSAFAAELTISNVGFGFDQSKTNADNYTITVNFTAANVDTKNNDQVTALVTSDSVDAAADLSNVLYIDQKPATAGANSFVFDIAKDAVGASGFYIKLGATNKISPYADTDARNFDGKMTITVSNTWSDGTDVHTNDKIVAQLYRGTEAVGSEFELNAANNWSKEITDLFPGTDYKVVETSYTVGGKTETPKTTANEENETFAYYYTAGALAMSDDTTGTIALTNTKNPVPQEKITLGVQGAWDDGTATVDHTNDTMTVQLYKDGVAEGSPVTLTSANSFAATFGTDFDKYLDPSAGTLITYTVVETGYSINGTAYTTSTGAPYTIGGFAINANNIFVGSNRNATMLKYGDVDGNGRIQTSDGLIVLKFAAHDVAATAIINGDAGAKQAADVDGNGRIQTSDGLIILKFAAHDVAATEIINNKNGN